MRKLYAIILLMILSINGVSVEFDDPKFKLHLTYDETKWEEQPNETFRDRLILKHVHYPVTLNVLAYNFNETITANGLVQKRIHSVYDGWQIINKKDMTLMELKSANVDEGILSIYRKPKLQQDSLERVFQIVGDICMVTDDTLGIIINTDAENVQSLLSVRDETNAIFRSFWYGDVKPQLDFVLADDSEWTMSNQSLFRQRHYKTSYKLFDDVNVTQKNKISSFDLKNVQSYHNKNGTYLWDKKQVLFLNQNKNQKTSFATDLTNPDLMLVADGVYLIQKAKTSVIRKYSVDFNMEWEKKINQPIRYSGPINDNLIIVTDSQISLLNNQQVEKWTTDHTIDTGHILAIQDLLMISDQKTAAIHVVDLNNGEFINTINTEPVVRKYGDANYDIIDVCAQNDHVVIIYQSGNKTISMLYNINQFEIEHSTAENYDQYQLKSITEKLIIFEHIQDGQRYLEALDFFTYAPVWKIELDNDHEPVITSNEILLPNDELNISSYDLQTGQKSTEVNLDTVVNENITTENVVERITSIEKIYPNNKSLIGIVKSKSDVSAITIR